MTSPDSPPVGSRNSLPMSLKNTVFPSSSLATMALISPTFLFSRAAGIVPRCRSSSRTAAFNRFASGFSFASSSLIGLTPAATCSTLRSASDEPPRGNTPSTSTLMPGFCRFSSSTTALMPPAICSAVWPPMLLVPIMRTAAFGVRRSSSWPSVIRHRTCPVWSPPMPRFTGLNAPKCSSQAFCPSQPWVMESPKNTTSPAPLVCSMRWRKSLCRGMSRSSFRTAGLSVALSCAGRREADRLKASTQPAGIKRRMGAPCGEVPPPGGRFRAS